MSEVGLEYLFLGDIPYTQVSGRDDTVIKLITKKDGKYNDREIQGALETHNQDRSVLKCRNKVGPLKEMTLKVKI